MLELSNFVVVRDEMPLFQPITQSFKQGEIWHIQGPNGQGKTTLLRALVGIYSETQGRADWSKDPKVIYLGHKSGVQPRLSVYENIRMILEVLNFSIDHDIMLHCMDGIGLGLYEETPAHGLSAGQFRKIALAILLHPEAKGAAWILDEPFTALDAHSCSLLESVFMHHVQNAGLILKTSHQSSFSVSLANDLKKLLLAPPVMEEAPE